MRRNQEGGRGGWLVLLYTNLLWSTSAAKFLESIFDDKNYSKVYVFKEYAFDKYPNICRQTKMWHGQKKSFCDLQ